MEKLTTYRPAPRSRAPSPADNATAESAAAFATISVTSIGRCLEYSWQQQQWRARRAPLQNGQDQTACLNDSRASGSHRRPHAPDPPDEILPWLLAQWQASVLGRAAP